MGDKGKINAKDVTTLIDDIIHTRRKAMALCDEVFVAQAAEWEDFMNKLLKAADPKGFREVEMKNSSE